MEERVLRLDVTRSGEPLPNQIEKLETAKQVNDGEKNGRQKIES